MNRQFLRRFSAVIAGTILFVNANAQMSKSMVDPILSASKQNDSSPARNKDNINNIKTNAIRDFSKSFKNAQNVSWFVIKDGFSVKFSEDGVATKSYYDEKGRWVGIIRTYSQNKLPEDIRKQVRSTYYDYSIYNVNEVTVGNIKAYLIGIENDDNMKIVRIVDGEMDTYQDLKKDHTPAS
ncbi:MAG: hypothetical protein ABJB86_09100 [Bacteroidota bacterium]